MKIYAEIETDLFGLTVIQIMQFHRLEFHGAVYGDVTVGRTDQLCGDDVLIIATFNMNICCGKI